MNEKEKKWKAKLIAKLIIIVKAALISSSCYSFL